MAEDKSKKPPNDDWFEKGGRQIQPDRPVIPQEVDERPEAPPPPNDEE